MENKPKGYWNIYENVYQEALKYETKREFQKGNSGAYKAARRHNWLDSFPWWKKRFTYTYEEVENESKKYETKADFRKGSIQYYRAAYNNKWLDSFPWLKRALNPYQDSIDNVYAYYFTDFNAVYIGRSVQPKERHNNHTRSGTVYKFAVENNIPVPDMTILESNLSLEKGCELEDYYINKYKEDGWNVLNKAKAGKNSSSIGSLGGGKNTYRRCYNIARLYKTRSDFCKNESGAYDTAYRNGWLKDYYWLKNSWCRSVIQLTKEGKVIAFYDSAADAGEKISHPPSPINACCRGQRKSAGNSRWTYGDFDTYLIMKMNQRIKEYKLSS